MNRSTSCFETFSSKTNVLSTSTKNSTAKLNLKYLSLLLRLSRRNSKRACKFFGFGAGFGAFFTAIFFVFGAAFSDKETFLFSFGFRLLNGLRRVGDFGCGLLSCWLLHWFIKTPIESQTSSKASIHLSTRALLAHPAVRLSTMSVSCESFCHRM